MDHRQQHARRVHEIHVRQGRKRGMAWAIIDGRFLLDTLDRTLSTTGKTRRRSSSARTIATSGWD
jgi:hypothetical protein